MTSLGKGGHAAGSKAREQLQLKGYIDWDLYVCGGAGLHAFLFVVSA